GVALTETVATHHSSATMPDPFALSSSEPTRPLSDLAPQSLFMVLFVRAVTEANSSHWGLNLHQDADRGGTKYQANNSTGTWITDHGTTKGATESDILIGLIRIADVDLAERSRLQR
ncbi:hypothetical protein MMC22_012029, partial [Lobaria immixta]|nr:hypothetical protein [Lobaria immixta]